ncbi:hypothetical protein [Robertmurraya massiliosenegalensis]|uniref:hypothetical protein n=1 Tax=Robertmurraya massiliosenegalensis TaxID=1287657 RepID=UPI0002FC67FD|nr:hypothetical protein [Robertmurraya massiliosenegalensis]
MLYRRDESFRFTFGNPIEATFKILKVNQISGGSKEGRALLMDLSPNGLRISSPLDLPINEKNLLLEISFVLNKQIISIIAEPKWKKRTSAQSFSYRLVGLDDEETMKIIVSELKAFSKKNHYNDDHS